MVTTLRVQQALRVGTAAMLRTGLARQLAFVHEQPHGAEESQPLDRRPGENPTSCAPEKSCTQSKIEGGHAGNPPELPVALGGHEAIWPILKNQ